jgi:glycosyltransferase involved in cell wall biosynthesis
MIPYGGRLVTEANENVLERFQLESQNYAIVIARPEPENSILNIVKAYSAKTRNKKLVILGTYDDAVDYQRSVLAAAGPEVKFLGAIYDHESLDALRRFSCLYIHGHTVGGTNPSLVEALGSGQPILAHDNQFNRWVAGTGAAYFSTEEECRAQLDILLEDSTLLDNLSEASYRRFNDLFTWDKILSQYEELLLTID